MRIPNALILLGVLCAFWAGPAHAEDDRSAASGAADSNESPDAAAPARRNFMSLNELTAELGLEAEFQKRTVRTDSYGLFQPRFDQKNKEVRFEETLGLTARGNIVSDKWLLYDAMIRGGLSQERYSERGPGTIFDQTKSPNGFISEYDLRLQALPAGKVSANAYASQLDDRLPRPFLPSVDRTRERYGAGLFYNDPKLPMQLTFDHLFDELESGNRGLQDHEEQGEDTLRYEVTWQPTDHHSLRLEYEYERRSDRYSGTPTRFDTTRHYLALNDALEFGRDHRSRLDTLLRLEDESGDLARDAYEFSPLLRLQHTDALFTTYRFQSLKQRYLELETDTLRGDWGITHQFEKLLTSTLGLYGFRQNSDDNADFNEWGGTMNFSFNKENALGTFSSNLSYLHSQSDSHDGRRGGVVLAEAVTFRDPLPAYLAQRNVQRFSIVVRDATGLIFFLEGRDYFVVRLRDVTALQRIPTGFITDRQTVFVSYTYDAADNTHIDRDRVDFRVQEDFKIGLTPYYALSMQDEQISPQRYLTFGDRNINRHRLGAIYRKPRWSIGPEFEYNDDSIDPYKAVHANGDVVIVQNERHQLDARGSCSYFRFDGIDELEARSSTLLDLGLSHRYVLAPRLEVSSAAMYRFQDDSLFGETQGVDLSSSFSYRVGQFTVLIEAEYDMLDLPSSSDDSLGVWIKVRREFPIIKESPG